MQACRLILLIGSFQHLGAICADGKQQLDTGSDELSLLQRDFAVTGFHSRSETWSSARAAGAPVMGSEGATSPVDVVSLVARLPSWLADWWQARPTGTPDTGQSSSASEATAAKANGAGDLKAFCSSLILNLAAIAFCLGFACVARLRQPLMYSGILMNGSQPRPRIIPRNTYAGWWHASVQLKADDVIASAGLDHWMLLEFCHLSMKLLIVLAIPNLLIMGPLHMFLGGDRSGDDKLSKLGMANVVDGSWLHWLHCIVVWFVVIAVDVHIYQAQAKFVRWRFEWLKAMPAPRSTSVLVESLPQELRTDDRLGAYFNDVFAEDVVESAVVVKRSGHIARDRRELEEESEVLAMLQAQARREQSRPSFVDRSSKEHWGERVDAIDFYTRRVDDLHHRIHAERERMLDAVQFGKPDPELHSDCGFVTFRHRRDAEIAKRLVYQEDEDILKVSTPPDPSDVIFSDLQVDETRERASELVGWLCVAGLFALYIPIIVGISAVASLETLSKTVPMLRVVTEHHSGFTALWDGMAGAVALTLMVSFMPMFLLMIFSHFFALKADSWLQHKVQLWYYYFNVIFVLLVTAVGSSLVATVDQLIEDPLSVFKLLADSMPCATHFYLNLYPVQWATHAMAFTRYFPLRKYLAARYYLDERAAKARAEPEDQDYYGMGSRSARFTIMLVISVVFCTLSPLISLLGIVNFAWCRLLYGYLFVYAETRKPDLGGDFWVSQLKHLHWSLYIYIVLMSGVLYYRGTDPVTGEGPGALPGFLAGLSLLYLVPSIRRFDRKFHWQSLPFKEVRDDSGHTKRPTTRRSYRQPELYD